MRIQTQTSLLLLSSIPTLVESPYGEIVKYKGKLLMRVKPTQFLLNSTLVGDVLNRGDVFVCNIESGTLYIMKGDTPIENVDASLFVKE